MSTFWKLLQESVITQAILTILVWASIIAMVFLEREIPAYLVEAGLFTLGFFFGAKVQNAVRGSSAQIVADADKIRNEE